MKHMEAAWVAFKILDRAASAAHRPVHIHLEEHVLWIGMCEHIVVHHLAFNLSKLVVVVVIAKADALFAAHLAYSVQIAAVNVEVVQRLLLAYPGVNDERYASGLVVGNGFLPPFQCFRVVARSQLSVAEVVRYVRRQHLHASALNVGLKVLRLAVIEGALAIIIVGSLYAGISHVVQTLKQGGPVGRSFAIGINTIQQVAHRVKLQAQLLLHLHRLFSDVALGRHSLCHCWQQQSHCQ